MAVRFYDDALLAKFKNNTDKIIKDIAKKYGVETVVVNEDGEEERWLVGEIETNEEAILLVVSFFQNFINLVSVFSFISPSLSFCLYYMIQHLSLFCKSKIKTPG